MVNAEAILVESGTRIDGHFRLTSGLHSPVYWEKFRILQFPHYTSQMCQMMAEHYRDANPQVVTGPTTGGIILAYEVARQLGVRGIFAEKEPGQERSFRRGFHIEPGERVLIVDDILTTGGSVKEVITAVEKLGGNIVGLALLVDRTGGKADFGYPFFSCHAAATVAYEPDACPLCAAGTPLTKPGSSQPVSG